jgi:hypothetical protein
MRAEAHTQSDTDVLRSNAFHPTHQTEPFVAIDQGHVERLAFRRVHDGCRVYSSKPFADTPFQPIAASEGAKHARIEYGSLGIAAELIGQLAAREMVEVCFEWSVLIAGHVRR